MRTARHFIAALAVATLLATGACDRPPTSPLPSSHHLQYTTQNSGNGTVAAPLSGATTTSSDSSATGTSRGPGLGSGH